MFLIHAIQVFMSQGDIFSLISNMNIITINIKMNMTHDYSIKQQMHPVERKLNMIIDKNPHLINSLNRVYNHPLIRNYFHILFST